MQPETIQVRIQISWSLVQGIQSLRFFLFHFLKMLIKSEVAIASIFHQTKQPKFFLLQVKTITKSPGNGIAESVKSCNLHQKGSFKA